MEITIKINVADDRTVDFIESMDLLRSIQNVSSTFEIRVGDEVVYES